MTPTRSRPSVPALVALCAATSLGGCATNVPLGAAYTDLTLPLQVTSASGGAKSGTAVCTSVLGLLATGDCSIAAAKADGGITTVTHADWQAKNVLGIIGTYTLTVTGD